MSKAKIKFSRTEGSVDYWYDHILTAAEHKEKSIDLVAKIILSDQIETEKKEVIKDYTDKLSGIRAAIKQITETLNANKERISGNCVVKFSEDFARKYIIHPDTGEIIFEGITTLDEQAFAKGQRGDGKKPHVVVIKTPNDSDNEKTWDDGEDLQTDEEREKGLAIGQ